MGFLILSGGGSTVVVPGPNDVLLQTPAANPYDVRLGNCCTEEQETTPVAAAAARTIEGGWSSSRRGRVLIELSAIVTISIEMDAIATTSIDLSAELA